MGEIETIQHSIADLEATLENVWELQDGQEEVVRAALEDLRRRLAELTQDGKPRMPKAGEQWVDETTGEIYMINQFGYAEGYNGVHLDPAEIVKHCVPYESEGGNGQSCDSSELQSSQSSDQYQHLREIQSKYELPDDALTYVWKQYPDQGAQISKLEKLGSTLREHPAWSIWLGKVDADVVTEVAKWEKRLQTDLDTAKTQFKRIETRTKGDLEFIKEELMPRIVEWAQGELAISKSKNKYIDLPTGRIQLKSTKDGYMANNPGEHTDSILAMSKEELERWGCTVVEKTVATIDWNLTTAKAEAMKVLAEARKCKTTEEYEKKIAEIPAWLKFEAGKTTGNFD